MESTEPGQVGKEGADTGRDGKDEGRPGSVQQGPNGAEAVEQEEQRAEAPPYLSGAGHVEDRQSRGRRGRRPETSRLLRQGCSKPARPLLYRDPGRGRGRAHFRRLPYALPLAFLRPSAAAMLGATTPGSGSLAAVACFLACLRLCLRRAAALAASCLPSTHLSEILHLPPRAAVCKTDLSESRSLITLQIVA